MAGFDRWVKNMQARERERDQAYLVRSIIRDCSDNDLSAFEELRRYDTDNICRGRDWLMRQIAEVLRISRAEAVATYAKWIAYAVTKASSEEKQ